MTKAQISNLIESTLGYTNGWRISDDEYKKHCDDIASKIMAKADCSIELKSDHWKHYSETHGGFRNKTAHALNL